MKVITICDETTALKYFKCEIPDGEAVTLKIEGHDLRVTPTDERVVITMLAPHVVKEGTAKLGG